MAPPTPPTLTSLLSSPSTLPPSTLPLLTSSSPPYQALAALAVTHSHAPLLSYCLTSGATVDRDVELAAWKGATPDLYAAMMDYGGWPECRGMSVSEVLGTNHVKGAEMVRFLMDRGARPGPETVLGIVRSAGESADSLEVSKIRRMSFFFRLGLLRRPPFIHLLPLSHHWQLTKFLIIENSQILAKRNINLIGFGTLQVAASVPSLPAAAFLLAHGVPVDEVPEVDTWDPRMCQNGTPLIRALEMGHIDMARFLVERGASRDARNEMGESVGEVARRSRVREGWDEGL